MSLVIDSSFLIAALFEEEHTVFVTRHIALQAAEGLVAPALLRWEIANVLLTKVRQGMHSLSDAVERANAVEAMRISYPQSEWNPDSLLRVGALYGLTAYDAAYLELAIRLQAPLATLDREMGAAAAAAGLPVHSPFA